MGQTAADEGGVRESRWSRAALFKRAFAVAGAVGAADLAVGASVADTATRSRGDDVAILNFVLLLEYLQEAFYSRAAAGTALRGELRRFARTAADDERDHVRALRAALGKRARQRPRFRFGSAVSDRRRFAVAALELEELTVAASIGQGANLTPRGITSIAPIVSVDARHAAWIRDIVGELPAPRAADRARPAGEVLRTLKRRGFVARG